MDFKELSYILCIAKNQSITKAAKELYISQPALSKFLQKIESETGIKLFHHINNQFTPTYAGECYLEYANRIMTIKKIGMMSCINCCHLTMGSSLLLSRYFGVIALYRIHCLYLKKASSYSSKSFGRSL